MSEPMTRAAALKALELSQPRPTRDEIQDAYRALAARFHPDRAEGQSDDVKRLMRDKFEALTEARRALLDAEGDGGRPGAEGAAPDPDAARPRTAEESYNRWGADAEALRHMAEYERYKERRQFEQALAALRAALARHPHDFGLGETEAALLIEMRRAGEGYPKFKEWARRYPELLKNSKYMENLHLIARVSERHAEALAHINSALALEPDVPTFLQHKALTLLALKRGPEADAVIQRLAQLDPHNPLVQERQQYMMVNGTLVHKEKAAGDACVICVILECLFDCL